MLIFAPLVTRFEERNLLLVRSFFKGVSSKHLFVKPDLEESDPLLACPHKLLSFSPFQKHFQNFQWTQNINQISFGFQFLTMHSIHIKPAVALKALPVLEMKVKKKCRNHDNHYRRSSG